MIKHSQYFTEEIFANALISLIGDVDPKYGIELGIGTGALAKAAIGRWPLLKIDAIDIDPDVCRVVSSINANLRIMQGDALDDKINYYDKKYQIALCNPPFKRTKKIPEYDSLFVKANLAEFASLKQLSADIVFIAKEMYALEDGGIMALVVPDGLMTRKDYKPFRNALLNNHKILHVVQLPDNAFPKTEARTHLMVIQKNLNTESAVPVSLMDLNGCIAKTKFVDKQVMAERMDFSFCSTGMPSVFTVSSKVLDNCVTVKRGNYSYKELRTMDGYQYLHSVSFSNGARLNGIDRITSDNSQCVATAGDLVMCRVGKRCVGKTGYVESGSFILSDCLFRIVVPERYREALFNLLSSDSYQSKLKILAHGVCSKVISQTDIKYFIISLIDELQC